MREAELFVMSEQVMVEVVGRIRGGQWDITLPPLFDRPGVDEPLSMRAAVNRYASDNARVPDLLAGASTDDGGRDRLDGDLLGADLLRAVADRSAAVCAAVRAVTDGDALVHADAGDIPIRDYLWQLSIERSFLSHEIAMHLGSRACPLTEEQARGMWEGTAPAAEHWRSVGIFREPMPMPADVHVSWRDRFLLSAGRDPHALEDRV